jgi:hypothetical protein
MFDIHSILPLCSDGDKYWKPDPQKYVVANGIRVPRREEACVKEHQNSSSWIRVATFPLSSSNEVIFDKVCTIDDARKERSQIYVSI